MDQLHTGLRLDIRPVGGSQMCPWLDEFARVLLISRTALGGPTYSGDVLFDRLIINVLSPETIIPIEASNLATNL